MSSPELLAKWHLRVQVMSSQTATASYQPRCIFITIARMIREERWLGVTTRNVSMDNGSTLHALKLRTPLIQAIGIVKIAASCLSLLENVLCI